MWVTAGQCDGGLTSLERSVNTHTHGNTNTRLGFPLRVVVKTIGCSYGNATATGGEWYSFIYLSHGHQCMHTHRYSCTERGLWPNEMILVSRIHVISPESILCPSGVKSHPDSLEHTQTHTALIWLSRASQTNTAALQKKTTRYLAKCATAWEWRWSFRRACYEVVCRYQN